MGILQKIVIRYTMEPKATRRYRLGKSSEASGTRGTEHPFYAVERSRLSPQAGAGKRDSLYACLEAKQYTVNY